MVMGQSPHRSNLFENFVFVEEMWRATDGNLGPQIDLAGCSSQDDPFNALSHQYSARIQYFDRDAFVIGILDMLAFANAPDDKTPLGQEKL
jgi:hypothetical protein